MAFSFVISEIVRPARIDMRHAITLSLKLQRRAPASMSAAARLELSALKEATEMLDADMANDLSNEPRPVDARPIAWSCKTAWGAFHARIESVARIDDDGPEFGRARAILFGLFPAGLDFVNSDHETLWHRGEHTLGAIARLGFASSVDEIAGAFVIRALRARHHALGVALGLAGSIRPEGEEAVEAPVDRRALLDAITASIARYAQCITAIDVNDAAAVRAAERALEPLVKFRAKAKASRAGEDDASDERDDASGKGGSPAQPAPVTNGSPANDTATPRRNVA